MTRSTRHSIQLVVLLFAAVACGGCGGGGEAQDAPETKPAAIFNLPGEGEMPGWSLATGIDTFVVDNLWEYINGQADFFLDYGFVQVDTAEYSNDASGGSAVLEVYRMGSPREAFGIFAAERTREDRPIEIGSGGYLSTNLLGFWQDEYYVKATSFEEGPEIESLLIALATAISSRLPDTGGSLEALAQFPSEGLVAASERFIPNNFLGQQYLTDAYRADYLIEGQAVQLFIMECATASEAEANLRELEAFQRDRDQGTVTFDAEHRPPTLEVDGTTKLVMFQLGTRLGGATGMQDLEIGRQAAAALAAKLNR